MQATQTKERRVDYGETAPGVLALLALLAPVVALLIVLAMRFG